jgi:hypothetical protein
MTWDELRALAANDDELPEIRTEPAVQSSALFKWQTEPRRERSPVNAEGSDPSGRWPVE